MKSVKEIERDIAETRRQIINAEELQALSKFPGGDRLRTFFDKSYQHYAKTITALDENNPALSKEYAKNKACLVLMQTFMLALDGAEKVLESLKTELVKLNGELQQAQDEIKRREKDNY
jgi:hypothetical protein